MQILTLFTKIFQFFPEEFSHFISLNSLKIFHQLGILKFIVKDDSARIKKPTENILDTSNQLGIAAGLDKNGDYIDCLGSLGIAFIEVGTVTPRPQSGSPKPRLFRFKQNKSLVNRMGFNNKGVDYIVNRLKERNTLIKVGTSIGKNYDTPNEKAHEDFVYCMQKVYPYSDYLAINISSPNTKGLRQLSTKSYLNSLLKILKDTQRELATSCGYKPIFVKISPDESYENIALICESIVTNEIEGIICTNTTVHHQVGIDSGGLSGSPLKNKSTEILKLVKQIVGNKVALIASGGVMSADDFQEKISSGADLVQIYSGLIFEGPKLIGEILDSIES